MKINELRAPAGSNKPRKRVGRGHGSGHVKTAGKGQKGQKSRSGGGVRVGFEGGQNPLIQRMPFKRGFVNPFRVEYEIINVGDLDRLGLDGDVTPDLLVQLGAIDTRTSDPNGLRVKLLGDGEIARPVNISVHKVSAGARAKIEAAGGRVEVLS